MHTYAPVCLYIRYDATLGMFKDFASYRYYAFIRWVSLFIRVMVHFTITCDVVHGMFDLNGHKYIKQSRERWYNDDEDKMHKPCFFAFCCGFGDGLKHFLVVFHAILTQNLKYCFCAIYSVLIRLLAGHLLQFNRNLRQESTHTRCDLQAAPCLVAHFTNRWQLESELLILPVNLIPQTEISMVRGTNDLWLLHFICIAYSRRWAVRASDWDESNL